MIDDGGFAFPQPMWRSEDGRQYPPNSFGDYGGMSLRDWFAGKALAAIIRKFPLVKDIDDENIVPDVPSVSIETGIEIRNAIVHLAYTYADAMIAERKETQ